MNIPFTQVEYLDGNWVFTWASGLGSVRVVLWGEELTTTSDNTYTYSFSMYSSETEPPPIEVVADGELAVSEKNPGCLTLQWYRSAGSAFYRIEYKQGGTWHVAGSLPDDSLVGVNSFVTPLLNDQTVAEWRVIAVDDNQRESDPLPYVWMIVRPPDPPTGVSVSCSAGTLTVE